MPPAGFEPANPASKQPQTYALDRAVKVILKGKAIPLQAWGGPEGSRMLRFPDFKIIGTRKW